MQEFMTTQSLPKAWKVSDWGPDFPELLLSLGRFLQDIMQATMASQSLCGALRESDYSRIYPMSVWS